MAGRWATLAIEAQATNAIDYNKPVDKRKEALIFSFLEARRTATCFSFAPTLSNDKILSHLSTGALRRFLKTYLSWPLTCLPRETLETESNGIHGNSDNKFKELCYKYFQVFKKPVNKD